MIIEKKKKIISLLKSARFQDLEWRFRIVYGFKSKTHCQYRVNFRGEVAIFPSYKQLLDWLIPKIEEQDWDKIYHVDDYFTENYSSVQDVGGPYTKMQEDNGLVNIFQIDFVGEGNKVRAVAALRWNIDDRHIVEDYMLCPLELEIMTNLGESRQILLSYPYDKEAKWIHSFIVDRYNETFAKEHSEEEIKKICREYGIKMIKKPSFKGLKNSIISNVKKGYYPFIDEVIDTYLGVELNFPLIVDQSKNHGAPLDSRMAAVNEDTDEDYLLMMGDEFLTYYI